MSVANRARGGSYAHPTSGLLPHPPPALHPGSQGDPISGVHRRLTVIPDAGCAAHSGAAVRSGAATEAGPGSAAAASEAEREVAGAAYAHPADAPRRLEGVSRDRADRVRGNRLRADLSVLDGGADGRHEGLREKRGKQSDRLVGGRWDIDRRDGDRSAGPDAVEVALRQVCELIESAVSIHRRSADQPTPVVVANDGPVVRHTVEQLLAGAQHSVSVTVSSCPERAQLIAPLLDQLAIASERGVTVRMLCAADSLDSLGITAAVRRGLVSHEVRVETGDLQSGVMVDGRTAFVRSGPERTERYASVIEDPASVRVLDLMFAAAWRTAMPVAEHLRLAERLRSDSVRKILDRLRAGRTDDVAAREIQVSLRTYRRHVAAIMRDVGANSRFQAGVRAYELGLLGPA
ncbi:helix-turn-helix transcriptional regulator [Streptomyces zagrosensis]|uniref:Transcription regulator TrmB C-terminal domain-containing protein n=1 Tax=Streptomyces zagrosensis TaxID=1042984 RepID=A0A7W9Q6J9_9ACTN|nr:TrmB family transcriptional regulator sugar-binding domain-containing protein [Streptomyces zagrosensis]MBB5934495.1 hypothetical protein [Streptomyces zagrosensis]